MGIAVNEVARGLRVATVYKHTPARDAGIQPGEVITAVNGSPIAGKDVDTVTGQIRGPAGTKVTLTVASRDGTSRNVTLTRREVNIPQVVGHIETVNGVKLGYVRLAGFFPGAHGELRKEVGEPLLAGRPGPGARSARQRRRAADGGGARLEHLRPERDDRLHRMAAPRAPRPSRRRGTRCRVTRWSC